jgi:hypothetical protein
MSRGSQVTLRSPHYLTVSSSADSLAVYRVDESDLLAFDLGEIHEK